jgi:nucleoside-diphosphate-sugar epimerase
MNALVTGVAGFIGSTLAERLCDNGADLTGIDCFTDGPSGGIARRPDPRVPSSRTGRRLLPVPRELPVTDRVGSIFHGVRPAAAARHGLPPVSRRDAAERADHGVRRWEQTRDFTYVTDAVNATIAAATRGVRGRVYNVGGGSRVTINEVLEMIGRVSGRRPQIIGRFCTEGRHAAHLCRHRLARTDLGFAPTVTLEDGLAAEYNWLAETLRDPDQ